MSEGQIKEPVRGMKVTQDGEWVRVGFVGEGNGLLIHQAQLADLVIDSALDPGVSQ